MSGERESASAGLGSMRRAWLLMFLTGCFGGLSNQPLEEGTVRGQLTGPESAGALVFVDGQPDVKAVSATDGSFVLEHVPVGTSALAVSAPRSAGGQALQLAPAASATVQIALAPAGAFRVELSQHEQYVANALVAIPGTPLQGRTDAHGELRLDALPVGCRTLLVTLPSGAQLSRQACTTGADDVEVDIELDPSSGSGAAAQPDAGEPAQVDAGQGCLSAGCDNGLHCEPQDGLCYACVVDADCPDAQTCANHACRAPIAPCDVCQGAADCGKGGLCQPLFAGDAARCAYACQQDSDCSFGGTWSGDYGFYCDPTFHCAARTDEVTTCTGPSELDMTCGADQDCIDGGLVNGRCQLGQCTITCSSESDCPSGWSCPESVDGGERLCAIQ